MKIDELKDKSIAITGGTGSFGKTGNLIIC